MSFKRFKITKQFMANLCEYEILLERVAFQKLLRHEIWFIVDKTFLGEDVKS